MKAQKIRIWDLPVRLFHWSLVIAFIAAYLTGEVLTDFDWHQRIGLFIVFLISFRLVWGVIGSTTARFSQFVRGKQAVGDYLKGQWQGVGHNPVGGWSVVLMLILLFAMIITGLFANNDADFKGPWAFLVSDATSSLLTSIHTGLFEFLMIVVFIHVGAIAFYKWIMAKDLLTPMIKGDALAELETDQSTQGGGALAILVALAIALLAVWAASGVWYQPPVKPPVSSPDW